ncbi:MarR family winged helix-turn-helix transcriptional regulator [Sphingomonas sp. BIUV-7]|uniref:MarR family winged helix-turn-helix transcriptional regulator n=1 Tax=Sphingomonas natans TaxID=3063330 RepID=A0ABT8Y5D9_9SPHN|nr:MarR family winged helix-turn-helix transcriptional regulator [Sphingomonas sp. BIUV-7]MDO6413543.1 MarR family winged helix-turn-helix transcriptional regulator [Sphingomonas sp. BIUV-7]
MTSRADLETAYARTLLPLARMWRQAADGALRGMGLSASIGWALIQVGRLGDDVRQTDLAAELDITAASLVRLIDQMVAAGLVERQRDPADARVSRVRLTAPGRARAATIEETLAALRFTMLDGIDEDDLATALRVAQTFAARFAQELGR